MFQFRQPSLAALTADRILLSAPGVGGRVVSRPVAPGLFDPSAGPDAPMVPDPAALGAQIAACARELGATKKVHLAVDGPLVRIFHLPLGFVPTRAELGLAVQTEIERYRAFAGVETAFDFQVARQDGERLTILFAALRAADLAGLRAAFEAAGVQVVAVEPYAVALVRALVADHAPIMDVSGEPVGVAAVGPRTLEVVTWSGGRLLAWRSLEIDPSGLERRDPATLQEASHELARTSLDAGIRRWLTYALPATPAFAETIRPDAQVDPRPRTSDGSDVLDGLDLAAEDAQPAALDLLPRKEVAKRTFDDKQLAVLLAFTLVLAALAGATFVLEARIQAANLDLQAQQMREGELQAAEMTRGRSGAVPAQTAQLLARSAAMARVFAELREVTPGDTWITEAHVGSEGQVAISGVALSHGSPMALAHALAGQADLVSLSLPDLRADTLADKPVYRFTVTAALRVPGGPAK